MDLIDTMFAKIHNIYKDYFWQGKPYEKSIDEFYELKTKIQMILKIYSDESIPLELQVMPLQIKEKIVKRMTERLDNYDKQMQSDYMPHNKIIISRKMKELRKCIKIVQSA